MTYTYMSVFSIYLYTVCSNWISLDPLYKNRITHMSTCIINLDIYWETHMHAEAYIIIFLIPPSQSNQLTYYSLMKSKYVFTLSPAPSLPLLNSISHFFTFLVYLSSFLIFICPTYDFRKRSNPLMLQNDWRVLNLLQYTHHIVINHVSGLQRKRQSRM